MSAEAILIAGPTASGKSAVALEVARRTGGTIVNADSMQVYRDLRIITNRPTPEEEAEIPHQLFGHVDGAEAYSVGRYVTEASATFFELRAAGSLPIVTGGTGLYLRALLSGLSDIPQVPEAVRAQIRAEAEGATTEDLHARLRQAAPDEAERLRPTDRQRILRALEVLATTGQPLGAFLGCRNAAPLDRGRCVSVFLAPDRVALRARIDTRFGGMIAAGALAEVEALAARRLDPALPVMRAHGVPGLLAHLAGELTLPEAIARGQADTRAYAKRQFTWFRHQMAGAVPLAPDAATDEILRRLDG